MPKTETELIMKTAAAGTPRRNRDSEILDAAISVFSQKGYSAASLQEIANNVGILKGSLYHYISSKEALLFRILEGSHAAAAAIMADVEALSLPLEEKFLTYMESLTFWYLTNRERAKLYQNEWRYLDGEFGEKVRRQRRAFRAYVREMVDQAVAEGKVHPDMDPDLTTKFVLSALDSVPNWDAPHTSSAQRQTARKVAQLAFGTVFRLPIPLA
jgi:AcrR family transcriptional regulator